MNQRTQEDVGESWTAITYPQDFCADGAELGPQTILRLQKLVSLHREGRFKIGSIVLACGIGPDKSEYPMQKISFARMMKQWFVDEGTFKAEMIHCSADDRVWNCIEVTMEMIRLIKSLGLYKNVLIVSAGFHIYPRMWVTWKILCSYNGSWRTSFAPEWRGPFGLLHELAGTIKYIPMAIIYRVLRRV